MKLTKSMNNLTIEEKNILVNSFCNHLSLCYEINMETKEYRKIIADLQQEELFEDVNSIDERLEMIARSIFVEEQRKDAIEFLDLSTVVDRLNKKTIIEKEFCLFENDWRKIIFLKSKENEQGNITHILLAFALLDNTKLKELEKKRTMEKSFYSSLMSQSFKLFFQPKYDPRSKEILGAEVLVRWQRMDGSLDKPDRFIAEFEKNGLIYYLDLYMFEKVCEFQSNQLKKGKKLVPISVNISRSTLCFADTISKYMSVAKRNNVDLKCIPLEITESALVETNKMLAVANSFVKNGFYLDIDDFGSGYSCLSNLNDIKVSSIKIDKSLIDSIGSQFGDALLEHIISFAHKFKIKIVAEGVETDKQVDCLRKLGCDMIQGFFFSKPMSMSEFEKMI